MSNRIAIPPTNDEPVLTLTLTQSSWSQIFETLSWGGTATPSDAVQKRFLQETGFHYSEGNFWAALQELQRQFDSKVVSKEDQKSWEEDREARNERRAAILDDIERNG